MVRHDVGTLERRGSGELVVLRSRFLVGRSAACDLRIDDPRVSGEHARFRWTGSVWEVRDLGSKNGTFVDQHPAAAGSRVSLVAGDTIALGATGPTAPMLVLTDATAPVASGRRSPNGASRLASDGLLVLPDDERPLVTLVEGRDGQWVLEGEDEARPIADGEIVIADGEPWVIDLPRGAGSTIDASPAAPTLESVGLRFLVSRDEERVDITVVCPDKEIRLPSRSHHYLLVTLARARLADARKPPAERGFLACSELCRMLATDELRINVDVHRARKQFAAMGLRGAADIVDRRAGTGRIRLGVSRVEVRREGDD